MTVDDFHAHTKTPLPQKDGTMSVQCNVIYRHVEGTGLDLDPSNPNGPLIPAKFFFSLAEPFLQRNGIVLRAPGRDGVAKHMSDVLQPYGGRRSQRSANPVTMAGVELMKSLSNGFQTKKEMRQVLVELVADFGVYLKHQCLMITGDYHAYEAELEVLRDDPALFGRIVPIPGAFHVGLNAQEGVFHWFSGILEPLWREVSGKGFACPLPPLQRKYVLDLFCRGWELCREGCIRSMRDQRRCPVEVAVLTKLFDDLIPVALDLYAVYLLGSMEDYECILLRGLELCIQLGKHHYVSVVLRFVATVQHWREKQPALYECFSKNMHCWTEEPVELFHAAVRHIAEKQRTSMALADAINTHPVLKENLEDWVKELGGGIDSGGFCVDHIPGAAEKMSKAIGALFERVLKTGERCVFDEGVWRS